MKNRGASPIMLFWKLKIASAASSNVFSPLGLKRLKVIDIRSSTQNSVKHLVELDPDEVRRIKNLPAELKTVNAGKSSVWLESEGCGVL
jgi:hypothetical protein